MRARRGVARKRGYETTPNHGLLGMGGIDTFTTSVSVCGFKDGAEGFQHLIRFFLLELQKLGVVVERVALHHLTHNTLGVNIGHDLTGR